MKVCTRPYCPRLKGHPFILKFPMTKQKQKTERWSKSELTMSEQWTLRECMVSEQWTLRELMVSEQWTLRERMVSEQWMLRERMVSEWESRMIQRL